MPCRVGTSKLWGTMLLVSNVGQVTGTFSGTFGTSKRHFVRERVSV